MPEILQETLNSCILCSGAHLVIVDRERDLCACRDCGLVFDNPRPTAAALQSYYSKPDKYDQWFNREQEREVLWRRRLRKLAGVTLAGSLLDIGAGTGQFLAQARQRFSPVAGTEFSASAVGVARERYGVELREGDLGTIDFRKQTFDCITLFHVLEHVPYPTAFLKQCAGLLSGRGTIVIAVPNELRSLRETGKSLIKHLLKLAGVKRFQRYGKYGFSKIDFSEYHTEIHLSHFTEKTLLASLEKAGLAAMSRSLDPSFAVPFPLNVAEGLYYALMLAVYTITGMNLYDTIWVAARKKTELH